MCKLEPLGSVFSPFLWRGLDVATPKHNPSTTLRVKL